MRISLLLLAGVMLGGCGEPQDQAIQPTATINWSEASGIDYEFYEENEKFYVSNMTDGIVLYSWNKENKKWRRTPNSPWMEKVLSPEEAIAKYGLEIK